MAKKVFYVVEVQPSKKWLKSMGYKTDSTMFEPMFRYDNEAADSNGHQLHNGQAPYSTLEQAGNAIQNVITQEEDRTVVAVYDYTPPLFSKRSEQTTQ